jgi:acetolactate synthase I/II/III large subunit
VNNVELTVRMLERAGVRWVFGVPSGPVLPLIEALRQSTSVDFVLTASETSAGFMAEAAGRLTGIPGVCVSTVGPGATNLSTGVGGAYLDRSPVIAITCNYVRSQYGRRTQMYIDHQALFAPLTKASYLVEEGHVAETLSRALGEAVAEPPGPIHLDFPEDVGLLEATESPLDAVVPPAVPPPPAEMGERVAAALRSAERPLVVTGLTFTRAKTSAALLRFIENQQIPFVSTLHAKGFLPDSHPAALGVMGRARRTDVKRMIDQADLVITVGFDPIEIDYEDWLGDTSLVHLSTEPVEPGTKAIVAYEATGDIDAIINVLGDLPTIENAWDRDSWATHRRTLHDNLRPTSEKLATHQVLDVLRDELTEDAVLTYDVGAHTHQIATQWQTDLPHTAVATNGWSSMGYGLPSAFAAKLARPDRQVVGVVGDGGFQMTAGELATVRRLGITVPIVVLNDGWLGLMKVKQERLGNPESASVLGEPLEPPAHYFGVPVRAVRNREELAEAIRWGLALDGPSVIETFVDVEPYSKTVFD